MKNTCFICDAYDGAYCRCTPKKYAKSKESWCRDKFQRNMGMQCSFCRSWKNNKCEKSLSKSMYDVCEDFEDRKCTTT